MGDNDSMEKLAAPGIDPRDVRAQLHFDHSLTLATSLAHTHSLTHSFSSWCFASLVLSSSSPNLIAFRIFIFRYRFLLLPRLFCRPLTSPIVTTSPCFVLPLAHLLASPYICLILSSPPSQAKALGRAVTPWKQGLWDAQVACD